MLTENAEAADYGCSDSHSSLSFGNSYIYVSGSPTNYIDPTGADACGWATAGFIVGTAAALGTGAAYTPMQVTGILVGSTVQ